MGYIQYLHNFSCPMTKNKGKCLLRLSQCFHSYVISLFTETTDTPPLRAQGQLHRFSWSSHFREVTYAFRSR